MKDLMIDIETFGTKPGSAIISIGAVFFQPSVDPELRLGAQFYASISLRSNLNLGMKVDLQTLAWWTEQDDAAMRKAFKGSEPLPRVLQSFTDWIYTVSTPEDVTPWGNAASFDLTLLTAAYDACGLPLPWMFYNERCYRTLKNLNLMVKKDYIKPELAHSAIDDAIAQAQNAAKILSMTIVTKHPEPPKKEVPMPTETSWEQPVEAAK